jgi:GTP cyclohydrolase II
MRFQALMPDVLHWLGIKKIDNMVSMSDMCVQSIVAVHLLTRILCRKYNAIIQSGIPILKRYDIPGMHNPISYICKVVDILDRFPDTSRFKSRD